MTLCALRRYNLESMADPDTYLPYYSVPKEGEDLVPRGMLVLGVGLPRTGTLSLRKALSILLKGKVYHGIQLVSGPWSESLLWNRLHSEPGSVSAEDIRKFFEDGEFIAGTDFPVALFWREILLAYPDAKLILTVRDPDSWSNSVRTSLYPHFVEAQTYYKRIWRWTNGIYNIATAGKAMTKPFDRFPGGVFQACTSPNPADARDFYNAWTAHVRKHAPADRLLLFDVHDGWAPLCEFLGVPVPEDEEFPKLNDSDRIVNFSQHDRARQAAVAAANRPRYRDLNLDYTTAFIAIVSMTVVGARIYSMKSIFGFNWLFGDQD